MDKNEEKMKMYLEYQKKFMHIGDVITPYLVGIGMLGTSYLCAFYSLNKNENFSIALGYLVFNSIFFFEWGIKGFLRQGRKKYFYYIFLIPTLFAAISCVFGFYIRN